MNQRPTIDTLRLILRPFTLADAPEVQRLAGDKDIAANTGNIPHPDEDGMAEKWIGTLQEKYDSGELVNFAIKRLSDDCLIGAIGLDVNQAHNSAELGYWVGKPYWNLGYATEAAKPLSNMASE